MPAWADTVDGHHGLELPFGVPGFRTQILIDAQSISAVGAVLTGVRFRADRQAGPQPATTVPNVTVTVSHSGTVVGLMNPSFAANVSSTPTTVFQGSVALPAQAEGYAGPLQWDIAIPFTAPYSFTTFQGNLLIDIVANNAPGGLASYWLDGVQGGGTATRYGQGGDNPSFDNLNLLVATGNSLEPRLLSPGHVIDFTSTLSFTNPLGVVAIGVAGLSVPIDLGTIGAPTQSLFIDPLLLSAHSWTQSFIGWYSSFSLAVPSDPLLIGERLYGQSALFDPTANALGLILGNAVEVRLGEQAEQLALQQLDANDPTALTGTLVDFGFSQPERGATPVLLEGVFF